MTTSKFVGLLLIILAGADLVVAQVLVGSKIKDPELAKRMKLIVSAGAAVMGLLGLAFFYGFIPL
ncbi:MAG: hypothetical protein A2X36_10365 [Elusimicrobia bacterium GWA2_69_24]|nr:MAG: hypothetical protein A2X36_10365 [Elusimicrobia bacterium GWA2_69_24]HBL18278.1 hypothetical protein [Elusimicrobiota bacterium]